MHVWRIPQIAAAGTIWLIQSRKLRNVILVRQKHIFFPKTFNLLLLFLAKAQEDKIKGNLTICKTTFQACKKYEDSSVAYVSKCKTSSSNLKSILSSLYFAKNKLNAVKSKASTIANTTSTASRSRRAALNSSTELISSITSFVTKCQSVDVDDIGTDTSITSLKSQITKTNVLVFSFTSTQISTATSSVTSLTIIITKVRNM